MYSPATNYNGCVITPHFSESFDKETNETIDGQSVYVMQPDGQSFVISLFANEVQELIDGVRVPTQPVSVPLIEAEYVLLKADAIPPYRKRPTDAGYDIYSIEGGVVPSRGALNIPTGIAISVKRGNFYTITGRSGLGIHKLIVPFNGTLDATYIGEVCVLLLNFSDEDYHFKKHERIAQILFWDQRDVKLLEKKQFSQDYNQRGTAGFGSSGK